MKHPLSVARSRRAGALCSALTAQILTPLATLYAAGTPNPASKPNIVFILSDDQRNDELGIEGEPYLQTPVLDRLASQGVRFQNMFATTSICMVSRATIFTGLNQRTLGFWPGLPGSSPVSIGDLHTSFPLLLRNAGYSTGYFGKQHVPFEGGIRGAYDLMFDRWEGMGINPYFKEMPDGTLRHVDELIGDLSVDFIKSRNKDRPFFLYVSLNTPHAEDTDQRPGFFHYPWPGVVDDSMYEEIEPPLPRLNDPAIFEALPRFLQRSQNRGRWLWRWDTPEKYNLNMRARFRMITGMDRIIGRVLHQLEEQGLADNTVIIFTADNGYYRGERGLCGKWSHFEESLRVPLIIHDPRSSRRGGTIYDQLVLNLDLPSTMLEIGGVEVPEKYQGRSLLPILQESGTPTWRSEFFCELTRGRTTPSWYGIRGERYVYALYHEQNPPYEFLHDLERDPDQLTNFAYDPEYASVLETFRAKAEQTKEKLTRPGEAVLK